MLRNEGFSHWVFVAIVALSGGAACTRQPEPTACAIEIRSLLQGAESVHRDSSEFCRAPMRRWVARFDVLSRDPRADCSATEDYVVSHFLGKCVSCQNGALQGCEDSRHLLAGP